MSKNTTAPDSNSSSVTPYETEELDRAAFIFCQEGCKIKELKKHPNRDSIVIFCFDLPMTPQQIDELDIKYANSDCRVEPNLFVNRQNKLRDLLHKKLQRR